jgi:hypothetical protein
MKGHKNLRTAILFEVEELEFLFPLQKRNKKDIVQIKKNRRYMVSRGDIISGDIIEKYEDRVWYKLHDNCAHTALIVVVEASDALIFAPYEATIYKKESGTSIETLKREKLDEGFEEVIIKKI